MLRNICQCCAQVPTPPAGAAESEGKPSYMEGLASPFTAGLWFAGDPKIRARDDVLKDMVAMQGDMDRPGEWGTRDLMKFIR